MTIKKSTVGLTLALTVCTSLLIATSVIVVNDKADLYIKTTHLEWPTNASRIGETYSDFRFYTSIEVWNRLQENVTVYTYNWDLLQLKMAAVLDNTSYNFIYGDIAFPIINEHIIEPGNFTIEKPSIFAITNYNGSAPPTGVYKLWAEFDGSTIHPMNIYNTTIRVTDTKTTISYQRTPSTWGTTCYWTPVSIILLSSGCCTMFLTVLLIIFIKRKKLVSRIDD